MRRGQTGVWRSRRRGLRRQLQVAVVTGDHERRRGLFGDGVVAVQWRRRLAGRGRRLRWCEVSGATAVAGEAGYFQDVRVILGRGVAGFEAGYG
jgi:hypothetical protein